MSNFENFKEELPSKERFYSSLTGRKITDREYEHVLNVWKKIEMKTMKDYHDLKSCGLCPSPYLSTPGLSWDAMLKMAQMEL